METKIEAEPEKETVVDEKSEYKPDSKSETKVEKENTTTVISESVSETTLQRLTPALIVSVSILLASGILSATSYANSRNMTPQVRNFYYQLPPPGPYMSNLAMPQPPRQVNGANNMGPNFRAPQMNRPSWARPTPPWVNRRHADPGNTPVQKNNLSKDQKSTMRNHPSAMVPPPWVNQPPQMNRPSWAQPTPPWVNGPQRGGPANKPVQQNNQNSAMRHQPPAMVPPAWVNQQQQMNRLNWARPTPPPWVNRPPQMNRPSWARPTPPWVQGGVQGNRQNSVPNTSDQEAMKK